ncbi:MAG: glutamate racemase [Peptococcaceae bacterium]|nr:glutamate racemase [Peptococcaceae bacterium]
MGPKIGMFDSGVGGLTVACAVQERMPQSSLIYYGDTARAPYGCRSKEELYGFGREIVAFLLSHEVDVIVVACNTSSAQVLEELRAMCPVPMIGMVEAAIVMAGRLAPGKRVGLMATEATVASGAFERAAAVWNEDRPEGERLIWVASQACPDFVPLVEAGLADSREAWAAARVYGEGIVRARAEAVILGCTHYPFLRGGLRRSLGPDVALLDPAEEVAERVAALYECPAGGDQAQCPGYNGKARKFYVSGDAELFWQVGKMFMGEGFARETVTGYRV